MSTFDDNTLRNTYDEVERIKAKLDSLYAKLEDLEPPPNYENDKRWRRLVNAKDNIEEASTNLLDAMDRVRP